MKVLLHLLTVIVLCLLGNFLFRLGNIIVSRMMVIDASNIDLFRISYLHSLMVVAGFCFPGYLGFVLLSYIVKPVNPIVACLLSIACFTLVTIAYSGLFYNPDFLHPYVIKNMVVWLICAIIAVLLQQWFFRKISGQKAGD